MSRTTGVGAVQLKAVLAFRMLLNTNAALGTSETDANWARHERDALSDQALEAD